MKILTKTNCVLYQTNRITFRFMDTGSTLSIHTVSAKHTASIYVRLFAYYYWNTPEITRMYSNSQYCVNYRLIQKCWRVVTHWTIVNSLDSLVDFECIFVYFLMYVYNTLYLIHDVWCCCARCLYLWARRSFYSLDLYCRLCVYVYLYSCVYLSRSSCG